MTLAGTLFGFIENKRFITKNENYLQFVYIFIGVILGSFTSSYLSGTFNNP